MLQLLVGTSALDADAAAAAWSTQRGVHAPKLAIRTTTESVGGRGVGVECTRADEQLQQECSPARLHFAAVLQELYNSYKLRCN